MSFSSDVKEELSKLTTLAKKEIVKAELIGYFCSANIRILGDSIRFTTENPYNIVRFNDLLDNLDFSYTLEVQTKAFICVVENRKEIERVLENQTEQTEEMKKAIIRGCFLGAGSVNDPHKKYHLEMLIQNKEKANTIKQLIENFHVNGKIMQREEQFAFYIKEGEEISKFLALIGANNAVLEFEEIRVFREMSNNVNRIVNCETANLEKTIQASVTQIEDIKFLKRIHKFEEMPDKLKQVANLRVDYPEMSLQELGQKLQEPISKSGVNHRLKKISKLAEEYRTEEEK